MAYSAWSVTANEQPSTAKWNILGTNMAGFADGTGYAAGAITPEKLVAGTGTSWNWTSFTPAWTNITQGTGAVNTGSYCIIGKTIYGRTYTKLGTTPTMGTDPYMTPPVTVVSTIINPAGGSNQYIPCGLAYMVAGGSTKYVGEFRFNTASEMHLYTALASATYQALGNTTSTIPFSWVANSAIFTQFSYEVE